MELIQKSGKKSRITFGQDENALTWLIILLGLGFVTVNAIKAGMFLTASDVDVSGVAFHTNVLPVFALSADLSQLASHPWTLLLYMFCHESVWSVISTLLWLWAFGYLLQDLAGNRHIFPLFLYGGLIGGIVYLISSNAIHNFANGPLTFMIGSGASLMAISVAVTTLAPNYRLLPQLNGGIPLWVVTVLYIAIDYATIATVNGGTAVAHLAAGALGFFYMGQLKKGNDWSAPLVRFYNWAKDLFNPEKKYEMHAVKDDLFYKAEKEPYKIYPRHTQERLDEILDKINQSGYPSLTEEEKRFLKEIGEKG